MLFNSKMYSDLERAYTGNCNEEPKKKKTRYMFSQWLCHYYFNFLTGILTQIPVKIKYK